MSFIFEEDDFDKFADKLKEYDIEYVHPDYGTFLGAASRSLL